MIPNPFMERMKRKCSGWKMKTGLIGLLFNVTDEQLAREAAVLEFEGLDTYADIYLNGSLLERTDNMFVGYTLPVKEVLRKGEKPSAGLFPFTHQTGITAMGNKRIRLSGRQ